MRLFHLLLPSLLSPAVYAYSALPPVQWEPSASGSTFKFSTRYPPKIYISATAANVRDTDGLTLIPPSTQEFAETFARDLEETFHFEKVHIECVSKPPSKGIYLEIDQDKEKYTYESGVQTSEGYSIEIEEDVVRILGAGARGVWWGTRTLLQELMLAENGNEKGEVVEVKTGRAVDAPAYPTRGFMLDAGRKWYDADVSLNPFFFFSMGW
jgi:hexosaminidase